MQALLLMISLAGSADYVPATTIESETLNAPAQSTTVVALNSLRDLFHGKPEAQRKALPPKQKAVITWASGVMREPKVDVFLEAFASSLMARDAKDLEPLVATNYAIEGLPGSVKPVTVLRQAIEQSPGPTAIDVKTVVTSREGITASAEFRYEKLDPKVRTIKLDSMGKLVWSDLFAIKVKAHDEAARG